MKEKVWIDDVGFLNSGLIKILCVQDIIQV